MRDSSPAMSPTTRVTLKDLAEHAGVSKSTVSLVLRNSPLVAEATRATVLQSIDALGYVYNRGAANLRMRRTQTVGLVVCEIRNPFYAQMTAGSDWALDEAGWIAVMSNTEESVDRQERVIRRMHEHSVDALILCPAAGTTAGHLDRVAAWRLPLVQALRHVGVETSDYAGGDYAQAVEIGMRHLVDLGHRRIAFIGGSTDTSAVVERHDGFRRTAAGYDLADAIIVPCDQTRDGAARGTAAWLDTLAPADRPTGILCYNDVAAFGAMLALGDRGLIPGRDMAVVGLDDIDEARLWRPTLSTLSIEPHRIGAEAARLALRRINNPGAPIDRIYVPPKLMVRDTSCPPPAGA